MKNFVQPGDTVSVTATSDVTSGAGVRLGVLFGVANHDALDGASLELSVTGVFTLAKATGSAWDQGDALYWNGTAATTTAGTGNLLIGVALTAQASADTAGDVRLNGASPATLTS